jgi:hypothetical protein
MPQVLYLDLPPRPVGATEKDVSAPLEPVSVAIFPHNEVTEPISIEVAGPGDRRGEPPQVVRAYDLEPEIIRFSCKKIFRKTGATEDDIDRAISIEPARGKLRPHEQVIDAVAVEIASGT